MPKWFPVAVLLAYTTGCAPAPDPIAENKTLMQYFEWFLPNDGTHWQRLNGDAEHLSNIGITAVWLPPPYKGISQADVGYGSYDYYDLGEFNQKGTVRTKYGTKKQLQNAIRSLHAAGVDVYGDMVLNHKGGADRTEWVKADAVLSSHRNSKSGDSPQQVEVWTRFDFPGRGDKYSTFRWNWQHFDGVDWNEAAPGEQNNRIFLFEGKKWDWPVSAAMQNYDFLLLDDIDYDNQEVQKEMKSWGTWMVNELALDGFRLDAVKHIKHDYIVDWLDSLRAATGKPLLTVSEYWGSLNEIQDYIEQTEGGQLLFDFPLRDTFRNASRARGHYDMRALLHATLLQAQPEKAVTFVENHDTQVGRDPGDGNVVQHWFKPLAYALILTWAEGYPMVFYADYYEGAHVDDDPSLQALLDQLLMARRHLAYGPQRGYFDHPDLVGWTRAGDPQRPGSGLAVLLSDKLGGTKTMNVGSRHSGEIWVDITRNDGEGVPIGKNGEGNFVVGDRAVAVYGVKNFARGMRGSLGSGIS